LRVRLEEHVLIHVRQSFRTWSLGERAVPHVELDGRQRDAVILGHYDLEAVRENAMSYELLELSALCAKSRW
jgi:hypothetical protein